MARPKKCRICGYRFKGNEDICPECFTAREDDIGCDQFSNEEHTHSQGYPASSDNDIYEEFSERSFVDQQRRDETQDPIPSATYDQRQAPPPANSYTPPNYSRPGQQQGAGFRGNRSPDEILRQIRQGVKQGRYGPQSNFTQPRSAYVPPQNNYGQGNTPFNPNRGPVPQVKKTSVGAVIAVFLLLTFLLPFIIYIAAMNSANSNKNKSKTTSRSPLKDVSIVVTMPEISIPDYSDFDVRHEQVTITGKYSVDMKFIKRYLPFSRSDAKELFTKEEWATVKGGEADDFRVMTFSLVPEDLTEDAYSIVPAETYLLCMDRMGEEICRSYMLSYDEKEGSLVNCTCLVPTDADKIRAYVAMKGPDGKTEECEIILRYYNYENIDDSFGLLELDDVLEIKDSDDMSSTSDSYDPFTDDSYETIPDLESFDFDSYYPGDYSNDYYDTDSYWNDLLSQYGL